jgi:hypothetical protein
MSRKKLRLDRSGELVSRDPAHCSFVSLEKVGLLSNLVRFLSDGGNAIGLERAASETGVSV